MLGTALAARRSPLKKPHTTIAHIGVAVPNLADALAFYRDILGASEKPPEQADGATILSFPFADVDVELMEPAAADSPIGRFIARRGSGIHHICFRVPDLDAALAACREQGYTLIDQKPRVGAHGRRIAFVHPKATNGILLELTE
jgi:methylmalonyl-CoA/ethylmalonyl-CoA epimerase